MRVRLYVSMNRCRLLRPLLTPDGSADFVPSIGPTCEPGQPTKPLGIDVEVGTSVGPVLLA